MPLKADRGAVLVHRLIPGYLGIAVVAAVLVHRLIPGYLGSGACLAGSAEAARTVLQLHEQPPRGGGPLSGGLDVDDSDGHLVEGVLLPGVAPALVKRSGGS